MEGAHISTAPSQETGHDSLVTKSCRRKRLDQCRTSWAELWRRRRGRELRLLRFYASPSSLYISAESPRFGVQDRRNDWYIKSCCRRKKRQ